MPEEGLVVGDGVNVDVCIYLEHVGDESAVGLLLKKALTASVAKGGDSCRGAAMPAAAVTRLA